MAVVQELIRKESDGTLSFGDYQLDQKTKRSDFEFEGDQYKVKTFKEITKLERNGLFEYESVPGTAVFHYKKSGAAVSMKVEAEEDVQIILEMEPETEYKVVMDGMDFGAMKTHLGGKLVLNVEIHPGRQADVRVEKK